MTQPKATIDSYNAQELRRCLGIDDTDPLPESLLVYVARIVTALRNYGRSCLTVDNYAVLVGTWQELEAMRGAAPATEPTDEAVAEDAGAEVTLLDDKGQPEGVGELVSRNKMWIKVKLADGSLVNRRHNQVRINAGAGA